MALTKEQVKENIIHLGEQGADADTVEEYIRSEGMEPSDFIKRTESTEPEISEPVEEKSSFARKALDIGLPVAGGIGGALVAGPAGAIVGAGLGRGAFEVGDKVLGDSDTPILSPNEFNPTKLADIVQSDVPKAEKKRLFKEAFKNPSEELDKSVIGKMFRESSLTAMGDQLFKTPIGQKVAEKIAKGATWVSKGAEKGFKKMIGKGGTKIAEALDDTLRQGTPEQQEKFIREFALKNENVVGNRNITEHVLRNGPKKVLKPEYLKSDSLSMETVEKMGSLKEKAFEPIRQQFDEAVKPVLDKSDDLLPIDNAVKGFMDDTGEVFRKEGLKKLFKTGDTKNLVPTAQGDKSATSTFKAVAEDLRNLKKAPTPQALHKFKQDLNKVIDKKIIKDVPAARNALIKLKQNVSNLLDDAVPGYKEVMNEYRDLFELEEELGKLVKEKGQGAVQLLKKYFNPDQVFVKNAIDDLVSRNDAAKEILEKALDEYSAKQFIGVLKKEQLSFGIPGSRGLLNVNLAGKSPRKLAEKMLKMESQGVLKDKVPGSNKAIRAGVSNITGRQLFKRRKKKEDSE